MTTKTIDIDNIPEENNRRPRSLKEVAIRAKINKRETAYLCEFMDEFYSQNDPSILFRMIEQEPTLTDEPKINAYYAAVAEHLALKYKLKIPAWTNEEERFLHRPHFPAGLESLKALYLMESPVAFRRRMIFVEADPLYRPRRNFLGIKNIKNTTFSQRIEEGIPSNLVSGNSTISDISTLDEIHNFTKEHGFIVDVPVLKNISTITAFALSNVVKDTTATLCLSESIISRIEKHLHETNTASAEKRSLRQLLDDNQDNVLESRRYHNHQNGGLRIYTATPEYLLAITLILSYISKSDNDDKVKRLIEMAKIRNDCDAIKLVEAYYAKQKIPDEVNTYISSTIKRCLTGNLLRSFLLKIKL